MGAFPYPVMLIKIKGPFGPFIYTPNLSSIADNFAANTFAINMFKSSRWNKYRYQAAMV